MAEPKNLKEYNKRFAENQKIEGFGFDTAMNVPCPFCAAPDWVKHKVLESEAAYAKGATCKECSRTAKALFQRAGDGSLRFEFVQTGGPDQPEWLKPPMRRVDPSAIGLGKSGS